MKTPREILLREHRGASPKLDAIRAEVLAGINQPQPPRTALWRDWLWPCPRVWAGLAAVWLVILLMNLAAGNVPSHRATAPLAFSRQQLLEAKRQQQMLAKLIFPRETAENVAAPAVPSVLQ